MRTVRVLGGTAALAPLSGVAAAHAFLDEAAPRVGSIVRTAPREIMLTFTQDLEPAFSTVTITDASGQRVDAGKPSVAGNVMRVPLRPIGASKYHVIWRVLSVDTHTTKGAFNFDVGTP